MKIKMSKETCKFCDGDPIGETIVEHPINNGHDLISVNVENSDLVTTSFESGEENRAMIHYCPMCGRKL